MTGSHLIGAHVSIAGGVSRAPERGTSQGCTVIQVFTRSPSQWRAAPLSPEECAAFKEAFATSGLKHVAAHDCYLINPASPDPALWKKSTAALREEVERCALLGIPELVMHPGSHAGAGERAGLKRVARALDKVLKATRSSNVRILLETTAGQGNCLGAPFEHLAEIIGMLDGHERLGVCFDTCHVFAAGYDIRKPSGFEKVLKEFDRVVGLERISLFHLNDSRGELGSRKDRHDHIGRGKIGGDLFRVLVRARRFKKIPKIIETPGGVEGGPDDRTNLDILFSFATR
jgi:deoxyribonuclease-4